MSVSNRAAMRTPFLLSASLLVALLLAGAAPARAQVFNLKSNMAALVSVYGEYGLSDKLSAQAGFAYDLFDVGGGSGLFDEAERTRHQGITVPVEARFFVSGNTQALQGFYIGPFAKYKYLSYTLSSDGGFFGGPPFKRDYTETAVIVGGMAGFQGYFSGNIVCDVGLGAGANVYTTYSYVEDNVTYEPTQYSRLPLRVIVSLGYRFANVMAPAK